MESNRILLRPWREDDAEGLYRLASDPEVGPRAGWLPHRSMDESREVISTLLSNDHTWAVVWKASGDPIGCICYYPSSESNIGIGPHDAEVGYWVGRPWWNQGIATEALRLLIDYCFNEKGFHTLWADHFPDNPASGRVLQKCGFRDTGRQNLISRLAIGADRHVKVMRLDNTQLSGSLSKMPHPMMATLHIDEIKAMARRAHSDAAFRERLFAAMLGSERPEALHAAWTLTHLPKEDTPYINSHRKTLTHLAIATTDTSLRRLTLVLLERLNWDTGSPHTPDDTPEYYMQLLDFCLRRMMLADESYGVRSLCMKLAYKLSMHYPELLEELRQSLLMLEPTELGAGVRCTRNKLLKAINQ